MSRRRRDEGVRHPGLGREIRVSGLNSEKCRDDDATYMLHCRDYGGKNREELLTYPGQIRRLAVIRERRAVGFCKIGKAKMFAPHSRVNLPPCS